MQEIMVEKYGQELFLTILQIVLREKSEHNFRLKNLMPLNNGVWRVH